MLVPELPIRAELKSICQISRYRQLKIDIFLSNARFVFLDILYDIRINTEESVSQSVSLTHDHSILIYRCARVPLRKKYSCPDFKN